MPEIHGIMKYEKPVLKIATAFDALAAAGKRCAMVRPMATVFQKIFLERNIDYYIYPSVEECNAKARADRFR